jgi:hypothetical protein
MVLENFSKLKLSFQDKIVYTPIKILRLQTKLRKNIITSRAGHIDYTISAGGYEG